jgi:hypothetical protein
MRRIIDYHVIRVTCRERLQKEFLAYVKLDFEPLGELHIERREVTRIFTREMVRYEPSTTTLEG